MDAIEQIGAYAGLAAVVGLGVLAALYFSQARDLKRLREWAGRAPERIPVTRPPVAARPVPRPPGQVTTPPRPPAPPVPRPPGAAPGVGAVTPAAGAGQPGASPRPGIPPSGSPTPRGAPPSQPPPGSGPPKPAGAPPATPAGQPAPAASAGAGPPEVKASRANEEGGDGAPATEAPETAVAAQPAGQGAVQASTQSAAPAAAAGTALPPREESANGSEEPPAAADATPQAEHDAPERDKPELEDEELAYDELEHDELEHDELEEDEPEAEEELDPDAPERHWEDTSDYARARPVPGRPTIAIGAGRDPDPLPTSDSPPILPPYSQSRPGGEMPDPPEGAAFSSPGRILAVVGATVAAAAVVALAIVQLNGDEETSSRPEPSPASDSAPEREARRGGAGVNPARVTVAVLNGTTVPGLAAKIGDSIKRRGFQLGNVANFIDQQRAESVVLYAPGHEREAAEVGRRLDIAQRAPVDAESQDIAGDATVVVIAGADQGQ